MLSIHRVNQEQNQFLYFEICINEMYWSRENVEVQEEEF